MLLPRWFPFHLSRDLVLERTVLVPLLVLQALKPRARNPRGVHIDELFPGRAAARAPVGAGIAPVTAAIRRCSSPIDALLRIGSSRSFPHGSASARSSKAVAFVTERLNGEDGLGAIFPAMANTVMMFDALGYAAR